ncbi:hypothetical protein JKP88DRAFT_251272 [Tribonema minus]|uniref:Uncharacterized protein n=1 Tax=Tribonema minus TaxID=303371 RepID=A0A836CNK8_9STRA|nr:hypothetical protein JKP88DRAFT_251272 [Tribonema minus]
MASACIGAARPMLPTIADRRAAFAEAKLLSEQRLQIIWDRQEAEKEEIRLVKEAEEARRRQFKDEVTKRRKEQQAQVDGRLYRYWVRDKDNAVHNTGTVYCGESTNVGAAWVAHGRGELQKEGVVQYKGTFKAGTPHGGGALLLLPDGESWEGPMWNGAMHGVGTYAARDGSRRGAVMRHDRRVCFLDELTCGARLALLSPHFAWHGGGGCGGSGGDGGGGGSGGTAAVVVHEGRKPGLYCVKFDGDGLCRDINLAEEPFRLLRSLPHAIPLELVTGTGDPPPRCATALSADAPARPTTDYAENIYHDDSAALAAAAAAAAEAEAAARRRALRKARAAAAAQLREVDAAAVIDQAMEEERARKLRAAAEEARMAGDVAAARATALAAEAQRKRWLRAVST